MRRIGKAVLSAVPPIVLLAVLPSVLTSLPLPCVSQAEALFGAGMPAFILNLAIFGVAIAALSALRTLAYDWSALKPLASSSYLIVSYALLLFILGFGDPLTFGTANLIVSPAALLNEPSAGMGMMDITLVSTFTALLVGIAVAAKIVHGGLKFREDRRYHELELEGGAASAVAFRRAK